MATAIDNLIEVSITQDTTAVAVDSFAIPIIIGATDTSAEWGTDVTRAYSSPDSLLEDGFKTSSPEYDAAVAMCSGTTKPAQFYVGKRTTGDIADDLNAIFAQSNRPYGVVLAGLSDEDILPAATAIEARTKILLASTQAEAVASTAKDDLASQLQGKGFNRTGLVYTPANPGGVLEASWMGQALPATPGSNSWAYCQLPGITADALSDNDRSVLYGVPNRAIAGKNVNVYQAIAGVNITYPGMMASGRFIDLTIGADWLQANVQAAVYQALVSAQKVPYTNAGVAYLINQINGVLATAVGNGLLDNSDPKNPVYCTAPNVNTVSATQRANRIAPTITFGGKLQGAIQSAIIKGIVAV